MIENEVLMYLHENGPETIDTIVDDFGAELLDMLSALATDGLIEIDQGIVRLTAEVVEQTGLGSYGDGVCLEFRAH